MRRQRVAASVSEGKKRVSNATRLPDPIRIGEIFTDVTKNQWKLGRSIGIGGFGEIYLASDDISKPVGTDAKYVVKVEPHNNGPLFVEMNFYVRAAKTEFIENWKKQQKLKRLGMPKFIGLGSHMYKGMRYRFLVLDRFSQDLNNLFLRNGRTFHIKTALTLAIQILDILEYIHSRGYVHADVKGSNLLLDANSNQVYLLDYGLACHYRDNCGNHKHYATDERKAHNGTVEYASRDAHIGAASRRGDLEILAYNLLQWCCSRLPWEAEESADLVHESKKALMSKVTALMRACFPTSRPPAVLSQYIRYVAGLKFDAKPDYEHCRALLHQGINDAGFVDDGFLEFDNPDAIRRVKKKKKDKLRTDEEPENITPVKRFPAARPSALPRLPCVAKNINRMTRHSAASPVHLRSSDKFSWEEVISSNPEFLLKRKKSTESSASAERKRKKSTASSVGAEEEYLPRQGNEVPPRTLTPAMRDVMERRWTVIAADRAGKRGKTGYGSGSALQLCLTPAMEQLSLLLAKPHGNCDNSGSGKPTEKGRSLRSGKVLTSRTPLKKKRQKKRGVTSTLTKATIKKTSYRRSKFGPSTD